VEYVHRIGRCGRMGTNGYAMTLLTPGDLHHAPDLANLLQESGQKVPRALVQAAGACRIRAEMPTPSRCMEVSSKHRLRGSSRKGNCRDRRILRGDWFCKDCGGHQYARNESCRDCGAQKPTGQPIQEHRDQLQTEVLADWSLYFQRLERGGLEADDRSSDASSGCSKEEVAFLARWGLNRSQDAVDVLRGLQSPVRARIMRDFQPHETCNVLGKLVAFAASRAAPQQLGAGEAQDAGRRPYAACYARATAPRSASRRRPSVPRARRVAAGRRMRSKSCGARSCS